MPALPAVPGVLKVEFLWEYGDKAAANVTHWAFSGTPPAIEDFVSEVATSGAVAGGAASGVFGADVSFTGCRVTDLSSDVGFVVENDDVTAGVRTGLTLPANSAVLAQYSISRRYRGGHARQYLPFFTGTDLQTPQTWNTASIDEAVGAWGAMLDAVLGATVSGYAVTQQVQVGYRPVGSVPKTSALVDAVHFVTCAVEVASMRRRDGRH